MKIYEYKSAVVGNDQWKGDINEAAKEGWRVVPGINLDKDDGWIVLMEREIED